MSIRATSAGLGTSGVNEAVEDAAAGDAALDGMGVARGDDDGVAADAAVAESGFELLDRESVAAPSHHSCRAATTYSDFRMASDPPTLPPIVAATMTTATITKIQKLRFFIPRMVPDWSVGLCASS